VLCSIIKVCYFNFNNYDLKIVFFSIAYIFFSYFRLSIFLNHNVKRFMSHTLITIIILHIILFN
jgi:hypothetical protein